MGRKQLTNEECYKQLKIVTAQLVIYEIFFGLIAARANIIVTRDMAGMDTAATDGRDIWFNPDFAATLTQDEQKFVIAHEVLHIAFMHGLRINGRDQELLNDAGDYMINLILVDSNIGKIPKVGLFDRRFKGMSMDEIYILLKKEGHKPDKKNCIGGFKEAKSESGSSLSEAEKKTFENKVKIAISQAAQAGRKAGTLPNSLDRLVKEIMSPRISWEEVLQIFISSLASNDFSYSRPNRRAMGRGIILPGMMKTPELGELGVIFDTSMSIGQKEIDLFASEISSILEHFTVTLHVMYVDAEVNGHETFSQDDMPLNMHPKGGGGTSFEGVQPYLADNDLDPKGLIYFTDMAVGDWGEDPEVPTLAIDITGYAHKGPDWMRVIPMINIED